MNGWLGSRRWGICIDAGRWKTTRGSGAFLDGHHGSKRGGKRRVFLMSDIERVSVFFCLSC